MSLTNYRLKPTQAADYLGLKPSTLAKWRVRGDGPRYAKLGRKIVVYETDDLDQWVAGQKRSSTSESLPCDEAQ